MSGGSSGPSWPEPRPVKPKDGGGRGGGIPDACNIQETTTLNSPERTVISGLRAGDVLDVVFELGPPRRLVAKTSAGAVAGAITSPSLPQFIQCITHANVKYTAEVLSVRGAVCQVRVQPQ
ncbi:hypothetical protein [Stigmatella aurantiaca]|uniref:Uncharacterized protein n=1 Tax=Stigmatella aurantiaca (strain DW4/3-1) TaxID=378806 RepID=Q090S4_STIAD|nr:hypothetical protein [Stigmatella aurantiaca]ADO74605.1 uncharacterized protein STAUR_6848 [Stigmatella aurantiaca DW4/3-1]EAU66195.1 hypothetical protein STIAU_8254 [Stigmatella aurantiaca DW4/3-1]